jgi:glycosyltransferase involved in cell wall biosynthesis
VVKIYGKHRRAERASKILRRLGVDHRSTVCVCQDDLMREALQALGITSLSFYDVIDRDAELAAWREAIAVRNELLVLLSRSPFSVKGYQCTEGLIGVDADQFAFLAAILSLKDRPVTAEFERIIFLPSEKWLPRIPDTPTDAFCVVADRAGIAALRPLLKTLYAYLLPLLVTLMPRRAFQECIVYRSVGSHRREECDKRAIRVLVGATDGPDFPSYYSRPAASIGGACLKEGHQTLIVTNRLASSAEYCRHGFEKMRYRKLVLTETCGIWRKTLRLYRYVSYAMRRTPEGLSGAIWGVACQLVRENLMARASAVAAAIVLFDDIFTRFLPEVLVVIPDNTPFGMAAVAVVRRNMVPSLTALAGQIFDHPQYGFLYADSVAVNSDSAREVYLRRGIPPNRVFVTGIAHYDDTFRMAESLLKSRKESEFKVVVFATENLPLAETFGMISPVASAALAIPQAIVVIRPHPREAPSSYEDFVKRFGSDRITVDSTTPLLELLSKADVCVTGFSNVAVEAMILKRPVICMNLAGKPDKLPYAQEGAALGVHHPDEVDPAITKALFDEETKTSLAERQTAYLKKQFSTTTGDASVRIVELIEELAKKPVNTEQTKPTPGTSLP